MIKNHHTFQQNAVADGDALFSGSFYYLLYLVHKNLKDILEFIYLLNLYLINEFPLLAVEKLSIESIHPVVHRFICPFNLLICTVCKFA
jgi:hypothetical protein